MSLLDWNSKQHFDVSCISQQRKNNRAYFSMNALHQAYFFRPTVLLCLVYMYLHPNAESLYSWLHSVH